MIPIACLNCRAPYPADSIPYICPKCGGTFDFVALPNFDLEALDPEAPGIWRYRHALSLPPEVPIVSLHEGATPLIWSQAFNRKVGFKLEYLNPTGSFKDRGTAILVSYLLSQGVEMAVEDSSGNAGASFAAYAARAGLKARIFIPDYASGPKRKQIEAYGAEVVRIMGPRSNAAEAVRQAAQNGVIYASHVYLPHGLLGFSSVAYELFEELGQAPGTIITPVGHGSLFLGLFRGFQALQRAGLIEHLPRLVAVQALACSPIWAVHQAGPSGLGWVTEGQTLAEGVRISRPVRGDAVLEAITNSQGTILAIEEDQIIPGQKALARRGMFVEPTSAIVWDALGQIVDEVPEPVIVVLTGSGYKSVQ